MLIEAYVCAHNEADILPWVLTHLREQGVRAHVLDNWSTDDTHAVAEKLAYSVERWPLAPTGTYDWTDLLQRVEYRAQHSDAAWCLHHDADEIRRSDIPGETLNEAFERIDRDGWTAMNFRVVNFLPIDNGWDGKVSPEDYFKHYEARSSYDRQYHVKAWKNLKVPIDISSRGGHEVWFDGLNIAHERFVIKHYPIRSQSHGEKKVFRERQARWNQYERFSKGWHCQYDGLGQGHNFLADPKTLEVWK